MWRAPSLRVFFLFSPAIINFHPDIHTQRTWRSYKDPHHPWGSTHSLGDYTTGRTLPPNPKSPQSFCLFITFSFLPLPPNSLCFFYLVHILNKRRMYNSVLPSNSRPNSSLPRCYLHSAAVKTLQGDYTLISSIVTQWSQDNRGWMDRGWTLFSGGRLKMQWHGCLNKNGVSYSASFMLHHAAWILQCWHAES